MYNAIIFTDITDNIGAAKPLGAYKCAQSLRENGYTCLVVDNLHSFDSSELIKLINLTVDDQTSLVGFSNTFLADSSLPKNSDGSTPPYAPLLGRRFFPQGQDIEDLIISTIRKKNPKIKIVLGGARSTQEESSPNVDYVCIGYSENSILNLINHLVKGNELKNSIKNIWGKIIIDDRKAEGYDFQNSQMIWMPTDIVNQTVLPLEVARGCIFKCKFCSFPMNGKHQLDFVRNEQQLMYELEKNYNEYGIYQYVISDDTFNDNDYKLDLFLHGIKKLKFQPEFWAYARLDLLARNISKNFQKLYDIGLRATQFGIETLHEPTGKIIGKGYSRKKQIEAIQYIRKTFGDRVTLHGTFIAGLPEETEESCRDTFNLLESQELPLHSWRWNPLGINKSSRFPWNSEIALDYQKFGYREVSVNDDSIYINWANKHTTFERATALINEFNSTSDRGPTKKLHNILGWSIMPLGYSREFISNVLYSELNFNDVENKKIQFMEDYKKQLFKLLESGGVDKV